MPMSIRIKSNQVSTPSRQVNGGEVGLDEALTSIGTDLNYHESEFSNINLELKTQKKAIDGKAKKEYEVKCESLFIFFVNKLPL